MTTTFNLGIILSASAILGAAALEIPALDPKGDVYKTEGPNDPLIYDSSVGLKKTIMLYVDFPDAPMDVATVERGKTVLGEGKFQDLFRVQSYGKLSFDIKHIDRWRRLPKSHKEYSSKTTEEHRELFVEIFRLYPEVDFLAYDLIMVNLPHIGNTAFGERDEIAIPHKGKKINLALNITTSTPYVLAHETGHLLGLPDLYSYADAKGTKNPTGEWDLMSAAGKAAGFLGWHRHKLAWLEADRKTYVVSGKHQFKLTPLNGSSGLSMIAVPADDPTKPSKVFVFEIAQPFRDQDKAENASGVLVYSVDATLPSGQNSVVVYPKGDLLNAPFQPGDRFENKDAPAVMKVLEKSDDGSYSIELEISARPPQASK